MNRTDRWPLFSTARALLAAMALLVAVALLVADCASEQPTQRAAARPAAEQPLPRSSIAALLAQRATLELSDQQVAQLTAVDARLQQANAQLRASAAAQSADSDSSACANRDQPRPSGRSGKQCAQCGRGSGHSAGADLNPRVIERLQQLLDDNDQKAFSSIEPLLSDAQRAIARAIAASYREQRAAQRAAEQARLRH